MTRTMKGTPLLQDVPFMWPGPGQSRIHSSALRPGYYITSVTGKQINNGEGIYTMRHTKDHIGITVAALAACAGLLSGCTPDTETGTETGATTGPSTQSQTPDPQDKPKTGEQPEFASGNDLLASVNTDLINAGATPCVWDIKNEGPTYTHPNAYFWATCDRKSAGELEFEGSTDKPHSVDNIYWHPDPAVLKEHVSGNSKGPVWATGKNWAIFTWRERDERIRAETEQMLGVRFTDPQDAANQLTTGIDGNGSGASASSGSSGSSADTP